MNALLACVLVSTTLRYVLSEEIRYYKDCVTEKEIRIARTETATYSAPAAAAGETNEQRAGNFAQIFANHVWGK